MSENKSDSPAPAPASTSESKPETTKVDDPSSDNKQTKESAASKHRTEKEISMILSFIKLL